MKTKRLLRADGIIYGNVEADFFENSLHHKHFDTIADLYNHCVAIMK